MARALLILAVAATLAIAGCAQPTPPPKADGAKPAEATSIRVTSAPESVPANGTATVCWRVDGSGNSKHVAVHWDNMSHPNATSFQEYDDGAMYPNNASTPAAGGYDLPGDFCTGVPVKGDLWLRAHVIDGAGPPGKISEEVRIRARILPAPVNATGVVATVHFATNTTDQPVPAGGNATLCWVVTGSGNIPHTAIHGNNTTHIGLAPTLADYAMVTYYPSNEAGQNASGYNITGPTTFCAVVKAPTTGGATWYFRAHAIDRAGTHVFSPEERRVWAV